jgi:hypothetical protein
LVLVKNLQLYNVRDNSMAEGEGGMGGDWDPVSMRCCGFIQTLQHDDTYGKKTLFGLFQGITPAYRSFKYLSV